MENTKNNELKLFPCYCDQEQGLAFFDGIFILADSIKDPRWDRIIPVYPEEQVFMCRQMTHRLKPGSLVLDVGTGSGVYAIWAAKHQCKVIAIDINPRSISFAKDNAKKNKINVVNQIEELEEGSIYFFKADFNDSWKKEYANFFDVVILSPGYTPSLIDSVIFHAKSGEDGQDCFNNFIEIVPHILKENGCCVGNQFTPVNSHENYAISKIKETFNDNCHIFYADIIEKNINTQRLYKETHKIFLSSKPELEVKISEISNVYNEFSLIYYEVIKDTLSKYYVENIETYQFLEKEWENRICLHRMNIEYANSRNFNGILSLFLNGSYPSVNISNVESLENEDFLNKEQNRLWHDSPLSIVSNYMIWKESWHYNCPNFDFILIDSAPIHNHFRGKKRLFNQIKIFFPSLKNHFNQEYIKNLSQEVLQEYQLVVCSLQMSKYPPIAHPYFTHIISDPDNGESTFPESTIMESTNSSNSIFSENNVLFNDEEYSLKVYEEWLQNARSIVDAQVKSNPDFIKRFNIISELGFSATSLSDISTPDLKEVLTALNNPKRFPKAERYNDILKEYNGDLLKALNDDNFKNNKKAYNEIYNLLKQDIEFITLVMHKTMSSKLSYVFNKFNCFEIKASQLLSFPLGLKNSIDNIPKDYEYPDSYRGGMWVYGATSDTWTLKHEQFLKDIARLNWLLFLDKYSLEQEKYQTEKAKEATYARLALLHQLPKDLTALNENLSQYSNKMTEFINKYGEKYPELASELPKFYKPDSLGVTLMFTKAAQDRQLTEMPKDCAEILYGEWNQTTIENFINRVVWTQAKNRALNYPEVREKGFIYYGVVEIDRMFPKPEFILDRPFKLDFAQGIYPLLLLGLRSAYQHSYLMTLLSNSPSAGEVKIEYLNEELIITNTGLPPTKEIQNQASWEKDLKILEGLTNKWKFHNFGNQYITQCSIYDSEAKYWITKIIKEN